MLIAIQILLGLVAFESIGTAVYIFAKFSGADGMAPAGIALLRFAVAAGLLGVIAAIERHSRASGEALDDRLQKIEGWASKIGRNTAKDED